MKIKATLVAVALGAVALTGCTSLDGEVTGKEYTPARTEFVWRAHYTQQCTPVFVNGQSSTRCSQVFDGMRQEPVYYPSCHEITVLQDEDGKTRSKCVKPDVYASVHVGDHFSEE